MKHPETAKRIKHILDLRGIAPVELATMSGVSKSSISQYVNGSHAPSNISAGKMAPILGVNPVWLMGFDAPMELDKNLETGKLVGEMIADKSTLELLSVFKLLDEESKDALLTIARKMLNKPGN